MATKSPLAKIVVGLAAVGVLAYLFVSTLSNVSSEPYSVESVQLRQWTIEADAADYAKKSSWA